MLLGVFAPGCYREFIVVDDPDGAPPPWDAGFVLPTTPCREPTGVDLLFVIDNSNSMTEEQASLAAQIPGLVRALVDPPDDDGDGAPDWLPIVDLQIGVVTTDMGTGGFPVPTCPSSDFGDDGVLRTRGRADLGCRPTYPSILRFEPGAGTSPEAYAADVACVAQAGTGGCGFEQPLEAALKALSPSAPTSYTSASYEPPVFFRSTAGHGDGANAGFVRDETLLAVAIVTDEEDCSAADPALFDPTSSTYDAEPNLRCFRYPEALHPVQRYVEGLAALRARRPDLLAFALVVGIPEDLARERPTHDDFRRILNDSRMQERVDRDMPSRLEPSCETSRGVAFPPRRLVRVAHAIGPGRTTVHSICQADFTPASAAIARLFGQRACRRFEEE